MADFTRAEVAHLLRRAAFGGRPTEVDALAALGSWAEVVDAVLDTSANPPDVLPPAVDDPVDRWWKPWVAGVQHWMDRMATSPTPLVEKMALFWHSNLASSREGAPTRLVVRQVQTYRALGLGDVHDLLQAAAVDPAMLHYLDNASNVAGRPNENFARELMELFVLGRSATSEADVVAMARAWTGHGLDATGERYQRHPADHDGGSKVLFGITRAWDGPDTITEMVRGSRQQTCARFLATKLWSAFAAPDPPASVVDDVAAAFAASGMVVREALRAIFEHPEFRQPALRGALVRSPAEWMALAMRSTRLPASALHPEWYLERAGHTLFAPPNVGGWKQQGAWISTSTQWAKGAFAEHARWKADEAGVLAETADLAPTAAAQAALDRFGIDDPSPATRARLEAFVQRERDEGRRWTIPPNLVALTLLSPDAQLA